MEDIERFKFDWILYAIIYPLFFLLGVLGNGTFLLMMIRFKRSMKSTLNYYLTSLATADLMILMIQIPSAIFSRYVHDIQNKILIVINICCQVSSVLIIVLLAHNTYAAFCRPLHHRTTNDRRTFGFIAGTWMIGGVLSPMVIWPVGLLLITAIYWIVFFINAIFVILTVCHLCCRHCRRNSARRVGSSSSREMLQIFKMITINSIVFYLCLFPYSWALIFWGMTLYTNQAYDIIFCFQMVNSAINPYIYGTFNAKYRKALKNTLQWKKDTTPITTRVNTPTPTSPQGTAEQVEDVDLSAQIRTKGGAHLSTPSRGKDIHIGAELDLVHERAELKQVEGTEPGTEADL